MKGVVRRGMLMLDRFVRMLMLMSGMGMLFIKPSLMRMAVMRVVGMGVRMGDLAMKMSMEILVTSHVRFPPQCYVYILSILNVLSEIK